jgi:drug/metabolite transporter (DMT)-like permease
VLGWAWAFAFENVSLTTLSAAAYPVLFVGILSSALTFVLMAVAVRHIPATHATILLSTETLFAAAAGHTLLAERLTTIGWLGAALVLAAVLMIQVKPKQS